MKSACTGMLVIALSVFAAALHGATTGTVAMATPEQLQDGVRVEKLADGFVFPEGPVWHPDGYLIFSDVHANMIVKIRPEGGAEPWINFDAPRKTNGMILSNDRKKIYACGHGELAFLEIDAATKGMRVVSRDHNGRPFCNVNDVAMDSAGHVFFTDPKWGSKPGDVQGVYLVNPDDGTTTLAIELDQMPNGLVVSPDQKWLYVARSGGDDIQRFRIQADGKLTDQIQWMKLDSKSQPDGMSIDRAGTLYVCQAGDGRVHVISSEGKTVRYVKVYDRMCTNCEFENPGPGGVGDGRVLYVTGGGMAHVKSGAVYKLTFPQ
ncbi:MAG: SMP-30/gluconolactonase/LRE family protein [Candidatus Sumerlaeaceae bacterium]